MPTSGKPKKKDGQMDEWVVCDCSGAEESRVLGHHVEESCKKHPRFLTVAIKLLWAPQHCRFLNIVIHEMVIDTTYRLRMGWAAY